MSTKRPYKLFTPSKTPPGSSSKPRLTHFLCLPLGHHVALRDKWTHITSELLAATSPIPGLHASILVPPPSLHLTLGVLSLVPENGNENTKQAGQDEHSSQSPRQHTVTDALRLLQSLHDPVAALLGEDASAPSPLMVPLERLDVMNDNPARSHVLWAGPDVEMGAGARLLRVCELVHKTFQEAGMLQDTRPLKLHCTLMNTVYRRPRGKRIPFSCTALRKSPAYSLMTGERSGGAEEQETRPWHVDLGTWAADEVQLCEMGRAEDGTYRSVGSVPIGGKTQ